MKTIRMNLNQLQVTEALASWVLAKARPNNPRGYAVDTSVRIFSFASDAAGNVTLIPGITTCRVELDIHEPGAIGEREQP